MKTGELRSTTHGAASSEERAVAALVELRTLVARLFAPDGCLWSREQSHATLAPYLTEEAREVGEAIEALGTLPVPTGVQPGMIEPESRRHLAEELGDVFWQVLTHARLAEQEGWFTLADVLELLAQKMTRRHPHIFGAAHARTPAEVDTLWAAAKRAENLEGRSDAHVSTLC